MTERGREITVHADDEYVVSWGPTLMGGRGYDATAKLNLWIPDGEDPAEYDMELACGRSVDVELWTHRERGCRLAVVRVEGSGSTDAVAREDAARAMNVLIARYGLRQGTTADPEFRDLWEPELWHAGNGRRW